MTQVSEELYNAVDSWFAENAGTGGCSRKDVQKLAEIFVGNGFTGVEGKDLWPYSREAAFEAVRKEFCKIQRYSFLIDSRGNLRRCEDTSGNWIEAEAAHKLFEPQAVDAAIAAETRRLENET